MLDESFNKTDCYYFAYLYTTIISHIISLKFTKTVWRGFNIVYIVRWKKEDLLL